MPANQRTNGAFETTLGKRAQLSPRQRLLLVGASLAILRFGLACQSGDVSGAIRDADRHGLYERTLENLKLCQDNLRSGLGDFCRQQAEFILTFPDCDESCRELSRRFVPHPTR
jgi:hypothetical protein